MLKIERFITNADKFGAISQVSFFNSNETYKTIYGGILSLMIYSLGFSYFTYLIVMWQTKSLPPTITVQQQFNSGFSDFKLTRPLYVFSLEVDEGNSETYDLQQKGDIFQYKIGSADTNGKSLIKNEQGFSCSQPPKSTYDYYDPICMNLQDEQQTNLFQSYLNRTQDTYLNISVYYCDPLIETQCLSFNDQSKIFNTNPSWRLTLISQEYDLKTGNIVDIPQDYYFAAKPYQNLSTLIMSMRVKKGTYIIDTGFLFSNLKKFEIVRSIELFNQFAPLSNPLNNVPMIAYIGYHLDRTEEIITVTYPRLGQILADLGSILQALLLLGLAMNQFNSTLMRVRIEKELLGRYFPEIKLFDFKYDWRGKIQSISHKGQLLKKIDFERMKQFRITNGELIRSKLNYLNILHEISRIQIQLQIKIPRSQSIQYQSLGYRIKLPTLFSNQLIVDNKDRILDHRDFQLLCFQKHQVHELDSSNNISINEDEPIIGYSSAQEFSPLDVSHQDKSKFFKPIGQKQLVNFVRKVKTRCLSFAMPILIENSSSMSSQGEQNLQNCEFSEQIPEEGNFNEKLVLKRNSSSIQKQPRKDSSIYQKKETRQSSTSKVKGNINLNQTL